MPQNLIMVWSCFKYRLERRCLIIESSLPILPDDCCMSYSAAKMTNKGRGITIYGRQIMDLMRNDVERTSTSSRVLTPTTGTQLQHIVSFGVKPFNF